MALLATTPVDDAVLDRISAALAATATRERRQTRSRERWLPWIERGLAGTTALIILVSSGVRIDSFSAAALAFVLGAALLTVGTTVTQRRSVSHEGLNA
jgi:hypothetical protein